MKRRDFLQRSAVLAVGASLVPACASASGEDSHAAQSQPLPRSTLYQISLAQWSLHRTLRAGALDNLDFAPVARRTYGLDAVEYVNQFFKDKARDQKYLGEMSKRASDAGVRSLLIMCDEEGALGDPDPAARTRAVENHYRWVEAARFLGCHSIRVNAQSSGSYDEQMRLAADGLRRLAEFGATHEINVIVENHGGLSSNGAWLAGVMKLADHPRAGTLPDFGNFRVSTEPDEWYDRYRGMAELMPFAKGVSAKSHDFDAQGNETRTDYNRMMRIVLDAGYRGYIGIEYEGDRLAEDAGIKATKRLLERVRTELAPHYAS